MELININIICAVLCVFSAIYIRYKLKPVTKYLKEILVGQTMFTEEFGKMKENVEKLVENAS